MLVAVLGTAVLVGATTASAHLERPSYWPNPGVDNSTKPGAGGRVPDARTLPSALRKRPPGVTRVVCAGRVPSQRRLRRAKRRLAIGRRRGASRRTMRRLRRSVSRARRSYRGEVKRNPSIKALQRSLDRTRRAGGYKIRPSQPRIR